MLKIDGAQFSGSGTILRYSIALSALLSKKLSIENIRAKREKPGLRPQHLRSAEAVAALCNGTLKDAEVGSMQLLFAPGAKIKGGEYEWEIGTAGSTTMLFYTVLPLCLFAEEEVKIRVKGGLFQDFAPSPFHMQHALFPLLERMGASLKMRILRPGYVPKGGGVIEFFVKPIKKLSPLRQLEQGMVERIEGIALSSHLKERKVSERMAESCKRALGAWKDKVYIECIYDNSAPQAGAALFIKAVTSTGCIIAADKSGAPGRSSEKIGEDVARQFLQDLHTGATVDRYLADQLIIFCALAEGESEYVFPYLTEHMHSNIWLVKEILGVEVKIEQNRLWIKGIGYESKAL